MVFLLSPQEWESDVEHTIITIGRYLMFHRQLQGITVKQLANHLHISQSVIEGIERGRVLSRGCSFNNYVNYADYIGISLRQLFKIALSSNPNDWDYIAYRKQERFEKVQKAIIELHDRGIDITCNTVSIATDISYHTLKWDKDCYKLIQNS